MYTTVTQLYKPLPFTQGRLYTGQYSHTDDFGLMYYVARWYDPVLGRMAQADTIVPGAGNPMAFDRYAYVLNNPLKYIDPSGHCGVETDDVKKTEQCWAVRTQLMELYGIGITGVWAYREMMLLKRALSAAAEFVGGAEQLTELFGDALRNKGSSASQITFHKLEKDGPYGWSPHSGIISISPRALNRTPTELFNSPTRPAQLGLNTPAESAIISFLHEISHVLVDARPLVRARYQNERKWWVVDQDPLDGNPYFPNHVHPNENLATSMAIYIETNGASYPEYQHDINFVGNVQSTFQGPIPIPTGGPW